MDAIRNLQSRLSREQNGQLNLMFLNALAELHNNASHLRYGVGMLSDCFSSLSNEEKTKLMRDVGKTAVTNRFIKRSHGVLGTEVAIVGETVFPNTIALELIDYIEQLQGSLATLSDGNRLFLDIRLSGPQREATAAFAAQLDVLREFYQNLDLRLYYGGGA